MKLFNGYKTIVPKFHDIYLLIDDHFYCKQLEKKHGFESMEEKQFFQSFMGSHSSWLVTHLLKNGNCRKFSAISIDGGNTLILNFNHFARLWHSVLFIIFSCECRSSTVCDPAKLENCNKNKIELCVCVCQDLLRYPDSEAYLLGPFFSRAKILPFPVTFLFKLGKSAREPVIDYAKKLMDSLHSSTAWTISSQAFPK